jgi:RNA polymerase primary sigma factor
MGEATKVDRVSFEQDYVPAMRVPEVAPQITLGDVYEGFHRHPSLFQRLSVHRTIYEEMLHRDDVALLYRVLLNDIATLFQVDDPEPMHNFLRKKWKLEKSALLADVRAYLQVAAEHCKELRSKERMQSCSVSYLSLQGLAVPAAPNMNGKVHIDDLLRTYETVLLDIAQSSMAARNGILTLDNEHHRKLIGDSILQDVPEMTEADAKEFIKDYCNNDLKHYLAQGRLLPLERDGAVHYAAQELRDIITIEGEERAALMRKRTAVRELERILNKATVDRWMAAEGVREDILLSHRRLRTLKIEQIEAILQYCHDAGIKVTDPSDTPLYKMILQNAPERLEDVPSQDLVRLYFTEIGKFEGLDREQEHAVGVMMVESRNKFIDSTLSDPAAAKDVALDIKQMADKMGRTYEWKTLFTGNDELMPEKATYWRNATDRIIRLADEVIRLKQLQRPGTRLKDAQEHMVRIFRRYGLTDDCLVRCCEKYALAKRKTVLKDEAFADVDAAEQKSEEAVSDEIALARKFHANYSTARNDLIHSQLKLGVHWAKRSRSPRGEHNPTDSFMDRMSAANTGIVYAVDRFDPSRGWKLSTYATWWIRQRMQRQGDRERIIQLPVYVREMLSRLRRWEQEFRHKNCRDPDVTEICAEFELERSLVIGMQKALRGVTSLDQEVGDETALGELIGTRDKDLERARTSGPSWDAVAPFLTGRELALLKGRMEGQTLMDLGQPYIITRERVRQIQEKALAKLRTPKALAALALKPEDIDPELPVAD